MLNCFPTSAVNVDTSTGTGDSSQEVEIKFNTASMTYAERLMLKKHRRTDIDSIMTPRENGDVNPTPTPRKTPRERPRSYKPQRELSNISLKIVDVTDGDFGKNFIVSEIFYCYFPLTGLLVIFFSLSVSEEKVELLSSLL